MLGYGEDPRYGTIRAIQSPLRIGKYLHLKISLSFFEIHVFIERAVPVKICEVS
jgi:hypothetical protein